MCDFQLRSVRQQTQARLDFAQQTTRELADQVAATPAPMGDAIADLFGPVIHSYRRRQAIEDGVLVQLSGAGYEGDGWIPQMVKEAGFRFPVAMTTACFMQVVNVTPAAERAGQDIKGRLWDVLWMLKNAIRQATGPIDVLTFELYVSIDTKRPKRTQLKSICGPGDNGEPVITIMFPHED